MTEAIVRQCLADCPEVLRTWFEWELDGNERLKTLIVEVDFDTDPNSPDYNEAALEVVGRTITDTLAQRTTMIINRARIVPRGIY